jgi:hypothetical protein
VIPRTLSASSLQVAGLCLDRWKAEYIDRAPSFSNAAADVGTTVHGALELFVKAFYIDKTHDLAMGRVKQKELLITFYQMSYVQTFGTADMDTPEYEDGYKLTLRWFERTKLDDIDHVESCELKETIPVPFNLPDGSRGEVPFNYIMDRVDYLGDDCWRVVDYKTIRIPIQPSDLEAKLQARAYALACQIKHPEAKKVTVMFDLIRHEPVSLTFTRDDNIKFWHFLCGETQRIINTKESDIRPTLNPECRFCVKKFTCPLMKKNVDAGGIMSLSTDDAAKLFNELTMQMAANKGILDTLEEMLMRHAANTDTLEWETSDGSFDVGIGMTSGRRGVNAEAALKILGEEKFKEVGSYSMTVSAVEDLIKDPTVDSEVRNKLKSIITKGNGNLKLSVKPKKTVF